MSPYQFGEAADENMAALAFELRSEIARIRNQREEKIAALQKELDGALDARNRREDWMAAKSAARALIAALRDSLDAEKAEVVSIENDMRKLRDDRNALLDTLKTIAAMNATGLSLGEQLFVVTSARAALHPSSERTKSEP